MSLLWHNGTFREDGPIFRADDRIRIGDGVFDTMLANDGKPVYADLHFSRLARHAAVLGITLPFSAEALIETAKELIQKNAADTGRHAINTIVSRGPAERGLKIPDAPDLTIIMRAAPLPENNEEIHAVIAQDVRRNERSPLSRIKSVQCAESILALREARNRGANEAVILNNAGAAACASAGNLFAVIDEEIFTPPLADRAMDGIIRALLIKKTGAREKTLTTEDLRRAQAVYITNSLRGTRPLTSLDKKALDINCLDIDKDFGLS